MPVLYGPSPPCPLLRCRPPKELPPRSKPSFLVGRRPLSFTTRASRHSKRTRDRCFLKAISAASAASVAVDVPQSASKGASGSPLGVLSRSWHKYWSLGRPQKQQQDKNPKKLRKIVSKLWSIMDVNGYLLTAALFCMVSSASQMIPLHEDLTYSPSALGSLLTSFHGQQQHRSCWSNF